MDLRLKSGSEMKARLKNRKQPTVGSEIIGNAELSVT